MWEQHAQRQVLLDEQMWAHALHFEVQYVSKAVVMMASASHAADAANAAHMAAAAAAAVWLMMLQLPITNPQMLQVGTTGWLG